MRFGKTLAQSMYGPWSDQYMDYAKLKSMLRESRAAEDDEPWTEEDENRFCDEIFNTQLEKVARFQEDEVRRLRVRVDAAFQQLRNLPPAEDGQPRSDITTERLRALEAELDAVTNETKELKRYSNLNYTGFLKIVKKHDRKRGDHYKIRPMMQISLSKRPFNSEQAYSPLLNQLSLMYFAIRQHLEEHTGASPSEADAPGEGQEQEEEQQQQQQQQQQVATEKHYTALKFWVHPDNLLEVKTYILRRLPALVYSEQTAGAPDGHEDPTVTTLYFDNSRFELYTRKVEHESETESLRLRWYGQLSAKPDIAFQHMTVLHAGGSSQERRIPIKEKYIKPFLDGEYRMEKTMQKMERLGQRPEAMDAFRSTAEAIQELVRKSRLEPVVRANHVRTAFQRPGDDRVRISIDTDIAFVREDTLDRDRPCRDPREWHRTDIDNSNMTYPFTNINQSEVSRFPYAVLEIKLKEENGDPNGASGSNNNTNNNNHHNHNKSSNGSNSNINNSSARKRPAWVEDLMVSHLLHPAPHFSKYVHGVASLFEDYVNQLPFWLSDLDTDIRKDPQAKFEEEEERRAQQAETEMMVGSILGGKAAAAAAAAAVATGSGSYRPVRGSPLGRSLLQERVMAGAPAERTMAGAAGGRASPQAGNRGSSEDQQQPGAEGGPPGTGREDGGQRQDYGTMSSSLVLPSLSLSRYSKAKKAQEAAAAAALPPGVVEPTEWLKNAGPLQIEPKVWLANERTFVKWQHICVLLGGLALSLYAAAGGRGNAVAEAMGAAYVAIAAAAGAWGYHTLHVRRRMIVQRSGRDFDKVAGPLAVSAALGAALVVNLWFAYRAALERAGVLGDEPANSSVAAGDLR